MKFTVRAKLSPTGDEEPKLDMLSSVFPSMVRFSYNRLLEGCRGYDVVKMLYDRFIPNARWCQWAVKEAQSIVNSQRELLPLYIEDLEWRLGRARRRLKRTGNPSKRHGMERRIHKLEKRLRELEIHQEKKTIPKAVFGSRRLFGKLLRGKSELRREWLIRRKWGFLSIGQSNQKGNANTRILREGDEYHLLIRNTAFPNIKVKLYIPEGYGDYIDEVLNDGKPYTIRVKRTLGHGYQAFITFELEEPNIVWNGRKLAGIDVNPTGIAVTVVSRDGNLSASKWFFCPDLIHAKRGKRNWLVGNLVKRTFKWLRGHGVNTIAIEDLNIKRCPDYPAWVNRLVANFIRKKLAQTVRSRAIKEGFLIIEVQPAYTSRVAELKYGGMFSRFNNHQLASFIIARRALGYGERLPEPVRITYKSKGRKRRIMVRYIWATIYGYSPRGLMVGGGSDGRMRPPTKAHGGCNRRVTLRSRVALDYRMKGLDVREDAHRMRVGQQGIEVALGRALRSASTSKPVCEVRVWRDLCELLMDYFKPLQVGFGLALSRAGVPPSSLNHHALT